MFHKIIYNLGLKIRNPQIMLCYKMLKKTEKWTLEELEQYQIFKLKKLLKNAYENSKFYRNKLDKINLNIDSIKTLDDLNKLPIITKEEILKNKNNISINTIKGKKFFSETSGSTGQPLVFYRDYYWDASHRAAQLRGYSWYGVKPYDKNGYLWGYNFTFFKKIKTVFFDILLNRFRLFSYKPNNIEKFTKKLKKAKYLEGYSSMIYEIAKTANQSNYKKSNLKMIKGTSEKIYPSYQEEAIRAFGKKIISEYGAAEAGIIAFECPSGNMHITMENVILEEIDGEAVVTNLDSNSFPIIRYKIGDSIIIDNETICPCGMKHLIVKDILGRVGKVICGFKNKYPSLTLYYIFKNIAITSGKAINYQAIQNSEGYLEIRLEKFEDDDIVNMIIKECKKYYKNDIKIEIKVNSLNRDYEKKFTDFVSNITKN